MFKKKLKWKRLLIRALFQLLNAKDKDKKYKIQIKSNPRGKFFRGDYAYK